MRKHTLIFLFIISLVSAIPGPARAAPGDGEPSAPLCPPSIYTGWETECSPLGPTQYLTEMAQRGILFPPSPLPAFSPDPSLTQIEYQYASAEDRTPIYATLDDAINNNTNNIVQRIPPGFNFISYTDMWIADGRKYYRAQKGWATSDHVSPGVVSQFQGLEFTRTPKRAFGWVLNYFSNPDKTKTKRTPGFQEDDYTGHYLEHLELVQIYDTRTSEGWDWYMIAPGEWISQIAIAKVTPNTTPPEGTNIDRWIELNLYEQTLMVYEDRELVFATLIATGTSPTWTYPGLFQIYEKLDATGMRGGTRAENSTYYLENVPWTMYFDDRRALHGAYWRPYLGFAQSHGCVNLSLGDAHWLYEWADVGDWVYVWDPSGETPEEE